MDDARSKRKRGPSDSEAGPSLPALKHSRAKKAAHAEKEQEPAVEEGSASQAAQPQKKRTGRKPKADPAEPDEAGTETYAKTKRGAKAAESAPRASDEAMDDVPAQTKRGAKKRAAEPEPEASDEAMAAAPAKTKRGAKKVVEPEPDAEDAPHEVPAKKSRAPRKPKIEVPVTESAEEVAADAHQVPAKKQRAPRKQKADATDEDPAEAVATKRKAPAKATANEGTQARAEASAEGPATKKRTAGKAAVTTLTATAAQFEQPASEDPTSEAVDEAPVKKQAKGRGKAQPSSSEVAEDAVALEAPYVAAGGAEAPAKKTKGRGKKAQPVISPAEAAALEPSEHTAALLEASEGAAGEAEAPAKKGRGRGKAKAQPEEAAPFEDIPPDSVDAVPVKKGRARKGKVPPPLTMRDELADVDVDLLAENLAFPSPADMSTPFDTVMEVPLRAVDEAPARRGRGNAKPAAFYEESDPSFEAPVVKKKGKAKAEPASSSEKGTESSPEGGPVKRKGKAKAKAEHASSSHREVESDPSFEAPEFKRKGKAKATPASHRETESDPSFESPEHKRKGKAKTSSSERDTESSPEGEPVRKKGKAKATSEPASSSHKETETDSSPEGAAKKTKGKAKAEAASSSQSTAHKETAPTQSESSPDEAPPRSKRGKAKAVAEPASPSEAAALKEAKPETSPESPIHRSTTRPRVKFTPSGVSDSDETVDLVEATAAERGGGRSRAKAHHLAATEDAPSASSVYPAPSKKARLAKASPGIDVENIKQGGSKARPEPKDGYGTPEQAAARPRAEAERSPSFMFGAPRSASPILNKTFPVAEALPLEHPEVSPTLEVGVAAAPSPVAGPSGVQKPSKVKSAGKNTPHASPQPPALPTDKRWCWSCRQRADAACDAAAHRVLELPEARGEAERTLRLLDMLELEGLPRVRMESLLQGLDDGERAEGEMEVTLAVDFPDAEDRLALERFLEGQELYYRDGALASKTLLTAATESWVAKLPTRPEGATLRPGTVLLFGDRDGKQPGKHGGDALRIYFDHAVRPDQARCAKVLGYITFNLGHVAKAKPSVWNDHQGSGLVMELSYIRFMD